MLAPPNINCFSTFFNTGDFKCFKCAMTFRLEQNFSGKVLAHSLPAPGCVIFFSHCQTFDNAADSQHNRKILHFRTPAIWKNQSSHAQSRDLIHLSPVPSNRVRATWLLLDVTRDKTDPRSSNFVLLVMPFGGISSYCSESRSSVTAFCGSITRYLKPPADHYPKHSPNIEGTLTLFLSTVFKQIMSPRNWEISASCMGLWMVKPSAF